MYVNTGTTLYRYTIRNGVFHVAEGVVTEHGIRKKVIFSDGVKMVRCPRKTDIGKILNVGPTLWLYERNDETAMRIFIGYEECKLDQLRRLMDKKIATVKMLRSELEEAE